RYASAYSRLALAEAYYTDQTGDESGLKRAVGDAERAIALAPGQADGYFARGYLRTLWLWDFAGARADFQKALALDPNNAEALYGYVLLLEATGDVPGALAAVNKVIRLDPLRAAWFNSRGLILIAAHDLPGARADFERWLELDPDNSRAIAQLAIVDMFAGHPEQGLARISGPQVGNLGGWRDIAACLVQHSLGHEPESKAALERVIAEAGRFAAFQIAEMYAWRGEKDQAFSWLERAYLQRDGGLTRLKSDPLLNSLRPDPRYAAFVRKMNLPT
ncbi:MAG TPA: tetratricopeptide repeat protein, partial [Steroidobacteraceae bacterium]